MKKIYTLIALGLLSTQAFSQIPEYCLENDIVHRYLTDFDYDTIPYTKSRILQYCDNPPYQNNGVRKDVPKPAGIKLATPLDTICTLYVSEWTDYTNALEQTMIKGSDTASIYNLIPGRTYNWKVVKKTAEGIESQVATGKLKTTGTLRMLKVDNIYNVRDMGGWPAMNGYTMKYGAIIRGSRLNKNGSTTKIVTSSGIKDLLWAGMRAELDMRDASNAPMPSGESRHSYLGEDYPIANFDGAWQSRIATFANAPHSIKGVKQVIKWLKQGKPVYMHCSVGADRTGTVAYLIGALCGMTENALCKDFELTSFSSDVIENEAERGTNEVLVRQRNYAGRLDKCSQAESYKFADMVDKIKANYPGNTLQEKVYYHLKTGVQGTYIPEADLDWLIDYMLNPIELNASGTLEMEKGQTKQLEYLLTSTGGKPNPVVTFSSSDSLVASVSKTGLITAKGGGEATIKASYDGFEKSVSISIPLIESVLPDTVFGDKCYYRINSKNAVVNGSFEYGSYSTSWTSGSGKALSLDDFAIRDYENSKEVYLEALGNGDSTSAKSIHNLWTIQKGTTYVLGFRIKNSTDKKTVNNPNIAVSLVNQNLVADPSAEVTDQRILEYPSYDGEWTDVQYIFTNTEGYKYIQIWFTHLSDGVNNTCFDNFYLCRLSKPTSTEVAPIYAPTVRMINDGKIYNLSGQEVTNPGKGVYIRNGKKYIVK